MTLPRWLTSPLCTRPELRPGRALLTPTWLAALAVLGVNDHLLKGAGVLPGGLTGKLSDLAGMVVAPALLAALLGLRTRRGLLVCHLAVGAVFAAIKEKYGRLDLLLHAVAFAPREALEGDFLNTSREAFRVAQIGRAHV